MSSPEISLNCLIFGHDPNRIFPVEITGTEPVCELKESIKLECMNDLQGVAASALTLYKIYLPDDNELKEKLEHLELPEPLRPMMELLDCFEDTPDEHLHVLVVLPTSTERKHELSWDNAERATKHREILKIAPSSIDLHNYLSLQAESSERLLDFRRPVNYKGEFPEKYLPPIEVLFHGFGEFLDIWRAASMRGFKPDSPDLDVRIDDFVDAMSRVYTSEEPRREEGLQGLNATFPPTGGRSPISPGEIPRGDGTGSSSRTDGHSVYGPREIPCIMVEFTNESGGSNAIPTAELTARYARMVSYVATDHREVVSGSRMPTLGITIVGPVITFFALAYVGSPVCVPLTTGLWCLPVESGGSDRYQLYTAFKAASVLIESIVEEARRLTDRPPKRIMQLLPQLDKLTKYHDPSLPSVTPGDSTHIKFRITGFVPGTKDLSRHIYLASSSGGRDDLVIKLTRSYSPELHAFCAHRGYAPKLYGYERLPGGVIAVAMEHIKGELLGCPVPEKFQDKWTDDLREMVKAVHDKDYVHGDLRVPNFLCVGDRVVMLDFDWSGKVGEASYPHTRLHPDLRTGRDMSRLEITKEDDDRVLNITLNYIRGQGDDYHEQHHS